MFGPDNKNFGKRGVGRLFHLMHTQPSKLGESKRISGFLFIALGLSCFLWVNLTGIEIAFADQKTGRIDQSKQLLKIRKPEIKWFPTRARIVDGEERRCRGESCPECKQGWSRRVWRERMTGDRSRYQMICCPPGSFTYLNKIYSHGNLVAEEGLCLKCCDTCIKGAPRTEQGREQGWDCYNCPRGWSWQNYQGKKVCLTCGEDYAYDQRNQVCRDKVINPPILPK